MALNEVVDEFGTYRYVDGMELEVADSNDLVAYSLKDDQGRVIVEQAGIASKYQRWAFAWNGSTLFVMSSDIGDFVWEKGLEDEFQVYLLSDRPNVLALIPESLEHYAERYRKEKN